MSNNINGFQIEKFNQYDLPLNVRTSTCPLCSHNRKKKTEKCLRLYWDTGLAECFHCGELLQLHTYKKKVQEHKQIYKKPVWRNKTILSDDVVKWFEKERHISQSTLLKAKVTDSVENMPPEWKPVKTIQYNYFRNGELINIKYRTKNKQFKLFKEAELILYNLDYCATSKEIIICEGENDALAYIEAGIYNVTSIPNGSTLKSVNLEYIDNCIEYFENKEKIYLALDKDEAGQNVTKELIRRFGAEKCFLVDFGDCKDANDYLIKYGKESLAFTLKLAKETPLENVSSVSDWDAEFDDYIVNGMQRGYITGYKNFDKIFSVYTGQYVVVTGIPSSGKSDWVDQMCICYNKLYGWKVAYASPENKPNKIHAGKLISKLCGIWVNKKEYLTQEWYKKAKRHINDSFKFIDMERYDLDCVLEKARELIFRYGIKVLVIDPYNKVRQTGKYTDTIEYTNSYLLKIHEFCVKHDILIFLVAHPVKPSNEERKTYEPDLYSVKGGGEFYDMTPMGLLVHRDYQNAVVKIKVLKVKFSHLGENHAHVYMDWNDQNGRYSDFEVQAKTPEHLHSPIIDNTNWIIERERNLKQKAIYFDEKNLSHEEEFLKPPLDNDELPF